MDSSLDFSFIVLELELDSNLDIAFYVIDCLD